MMKFKPVLLLAGILFVVILMIPTILVLPFGEEKVSGKLEENVVAPTTAQPQKADAGPAVEVAVYRTAQEKVEKLELEEYIIGVVASEMPADFEKEALKAQALTARTYIVRKMVSGEKMPQDADVGDTQFYQVYKNREELKKLWGADYDWKIKRIEEAVKETSGQILTYNQAPIDATFFSTSNGFTENSESVWSGSLPYLKSVESPWDKESPKFSGQEVISISEFQSKLGVKLSDHTTIGEVTERTVGKRVGKVKIGGKEFTGQEIREKLGLMSTDFTWERKGDKIVITTKGYGHGVGMSQYGANGMAEEGKNYQEIVQHYYQGVEITASDSFITTLTAKNN
jgi:stage II sporulation protein D